MVQEEKSMTERQEGKKNKQGKNKGIFILAAVLVILLAVYFGLRAWNQNEEKQQEEKEKEAQIHVTDTEAGDITAMSFDVGNGEMSFSKEDGAWKYTPDEDFPLDQSYPENMASALGSITADRELEDGDDLADYGLEEPVYTLSFTDKEENTTDLYFGNMTGDDYYVTVGDTGKVYTVASTVIESLNYTLDDIAQLDEYPSIGSGNLVKETIIQNGETTVYDSENEDQEEDITAVAGGLGAVEVSGAADYSVADEDLAGFGLDEASRITVEAVYTEDDEEKTLTLYIGGEDGDGNRYVMINDSRIVYLISDEICDNILNI